MESKKYQIFISSTYKDLIQARKKVSDAILKSYHFPVGMELFSAGDKSQWEVITKIIDKTDYYILILGHRYGSLSPEGIGYTEMEYNYAKSLGIPVLSFIRHDDVATKQYERESDPELIEKLEIFRKNAMANKMCDFWETEEDLESKILMALYKSFATNPRTGWVRGDQAINPEIANEIALLTKENRELKNKLENFQKEERKPEIELEINGEKHLTIEYKEIANEKLPKEIKTTDIPLDLQNYIDPKELDEYNVFLNNTDVVTEYFQKIDKYNKIQNNNLELVFGITNNGNIKANNVMIDIKFPKEVLILERDKFNDLKKPINPFPINPIESAEQRKLSYSMDYIDLIRSAPITALKLPKLPRIPSIHQNRWLWVEKENITIKINNLLHTRTVEFKDEDSVYIIPLKKGEYEITVEVISEELLKKDVFQIPLLIK